MGTTERVAAAFEAVPRTAFLPPDQQRYAGEDRPLPIGHDATNSQPSTVRAMLELLDPRPGDRVLDVGAGSGWTTALLARLVGPQGHVVALERVPELVELCRANLGIVPDEKHPGAVVPDEKHLETGISGAFRQGLPPSPAPIEVHEATPGVLGRPERAPYDRILVSAGATELPGDLVGQLATGGVMVVPVDAEMLRVTRTTDGTTVEQHGRYVFVPLVP